LKKNSFSTHFLDRCSLERTDLNWINTRLKDKLTSIIPVWDTKIFCHKHNQQQAVYPGIGDFDGMANKPESLTFLGLAEGRAYFTVPVDSADQASRLSDQTKGTFVDFRRTAPLLSYRDCALLSLARFMINWHSRHVFCGKCGCRTSVSEAGNVRYCSNESCKETFYPSMDPAVIVLVSSGARCLLGRQPPWPKDMYSTIAGFVEPGESIEDAVFREVEEETGIQVKDIEYLSSQPWLFPASLMLGFNANTVNKKIVINKNELEDVRWFSREEIRENLEKGKMQLPMKVSIAYNLIKDWYGQGNAGELDDLIKS
jgi:NAD+ diphosphatase